MLTIMQYDSFFTNLCISLCTVYSVRKCQTVNQQYYTEIVTKLRERVRRK